MENCVAICPIGGSNRAGAARYLSEREVPMAPEGQPDYRIRESKARFMRLESEQLKKITVLWLHQRFARQRA